MQPISPFLWFDDQAHRRVRDADAAKAGRVMQAMMRTGKLDIAGLRAAYNAD